MHDHDSPDDVCAGAAKLVGEVVSLLQPGAMMTKFVLVATIINEDGSDGLWTQTSHGLAPWDVLGLIEFAKEGERIRMLKHEVDGHD